MVDLNFVSAIGKGSICRKSYGEIVSKRAPWRYTTLCSTNYTIHMGGAIHEQTMKMNRGRLISEIVVQIDNHSIADRSLDTWNGPLSIDTDDWSFEEAVRICPHPFGGEVIDTSFCFCNREEDEGTTDEELRK